MGKRLRKSKSVKDVEDSRDDEKTSAETTTSSDEAEANEDISLKVVKKSMELCVGAKSNGSFSEVVTDLKVREKQKTKRKKSQNVECVPDSVQSNISTRSKDFSREQILLDDTVDRNEPKNIDEKIDISLNLVESNPTEASENMVLMKLLRGPRYFDPPGSSWGACYNCGEEGHSAINCPAEKRKKPCFVCGSFEHHAKQCSKGRDCFFCNRQGHLAKDCPEKQRGSKLCLKCGDFGHDFFSCRNDYSPDDLKEIKCYICGKFGHLCCVEYTDPGPRKVSCYECGQSGHIGSDCPNNIAVEAAPTYTSSSCYKCGFEGHLARDCYSTKFLPSDGVGEANQTYTSSSCYKCGFEGHLARDCYSTKFLPSNSVGEANPAYTSSSCYKCGFEGHLARECSRFPKAATQNREPSTPKLGDSSSKKKRDRRDVKSSASRVLEKRYKKKKFLFDEFDSVEKSKRKVGWTAEHPGDSHGRSARPKKQRRFTETAPPFVPWKPKISTTSNGHRPLKTGYQYDDSGFNGGGGGSNGLYHRNGVSGSRFGGGRNYYGEYDYWFPEQGWRH